MFKQYLKPLMFFYAVTAILSMLCLNNIISNSAIGTYSNRLSLLVGFPVLLVIGYMIAYKKEITPLDVFLKSSNFFIYAFHILPLNFMMKILLILMEPQTELAVLFIYFTSPILTLVIGLLLFVLLNSKIPRVASLLTGGRN